MQITFTGPHVDISDALRDFTKGKLERIHRHFERITNINITFVIEKLVNKVEATVQIPGNTIHASSDSETDMYSAVDTLVDKLDRQLKKIKEKGDVY